MTHVSRPTTGNTYAIGRFSPDGPTGYVAVHDDGSHGPQRDTRAQAESDYTAAQEATTAHARITDWEARRYIRILDRLSAEVEHMDASDSRIKEVSKRLYDVIKEAEALYGPEALTSISTLSRQDKEKVDQLFSRREQQDAEANRATQRARYREEARFQLAQTRQRTVYRWYELAPDVYGTKVLLAGLRATAHMKTDGTFWVEIAQHGQPISESHAGTLMQAAEWAGYEMKEIVRTGARH